MSPLRHARSKTIIDTVTTRLLDMFHTALVIAGLWNYMIKFFGNADHIDIIPWYVNSYNATISGLTLIWCRTISVRAFYFVSDHPIEYPMKGTVAVTVCISPTQMFHSLKDYYRAF